MNHVMLGMIGSGEILVILIMLLVMAAVVVGVVFLVVWLAGRQKSSPPTNPPGASQPMPPASATCPRCGAVMPSNSPQGICPRCVLGVGLATETEATGEAGPHGTKVVPPPEAEVARRFPSLEIGGCLGQGGMGVVYKARQPKLNRLVALKILSPERGADPKFAERFLREAQALARLSHPNIVTVHDFGEADGMFFLLMEYVDGMTLRQLLREGRMKPEEALAIVPPICEALQFAHEQGVVHRDIKPENVLLDKQGRVKIADFGIAKLVGTEGLRPGLTEERSVIGTPHYMAPEQVEKPQLVDHRADIYSLGVVFYEMLTGELPLGKFQPPSKKVQVDVRLDEVVLHALEKEPDRRYQHASEVKSDVETIATGAVKPEVRSPKSGLNQRLVAPNAAVQGIVKGPAIGLLVTGVLNWVLIPLALLILLPKAILFALVPLVLCSFIIFGALKMMRLEAYSAAIAASILAILITPGNLIGLPVGIWALVVLSRREVRETFGKGYSHPVGASASAAPPPPRPDRFWRRFAVVVALVLLAMVLIPVGSMLLAIVIPSFSRAWQKAQVIETDSGRIFRVEEKLRQEIEKRLGEAGWRVEGLSVNVRSDLKQAECRLGRIWKNGLTQEPPPPAAIHLEPQGSGLWLVRGEGEFQSIRFSVDTSAEMADSESFVKLVTRAASFGPVIERVIPDFESLEPPQALRLLAGEVSEIPVGLFKAGDQTAAGEWATTNRMLAFINFGGDSRGFSCSGWKFGDLPETAWDHTGPESIEPALAAGTSVLKPKQLGRGSQGFEIPLDVHLPLNLAFETSLGDRGLLQIVGITRQPRSITVRYKLLQPALLSSATAQKPSFGQAVEAVLPFGAPCENHYLRFRSGHVFTIGRGPATTEVEYSEDWKRAEEAGGVDASAIRLKDGIQLIGEGCIFTQGHRLNWDATTADEVIKQLEHTSWVSGVVEPKTKDFPITYLFKTARGECGLVQALEVVEDDRGYAGAGKQGQGLKLRYKFVQTTLAPAASSEAKPDMPRKYVRLVVATDAITFEGEPTTWDDLGALLAKVPGRTNTVLEFAVTSDQITVAQQNEWFQKAIALARQYGFEYASFIGIHPLSSKGTHSSSAPAGRPASQSAVFGPVIDRTVSGERDSQLRFIDLDTGHQFAALEFSEANAEPSPDEARRWYNQNGIDAMADTAPAVKGLVGFDLLALPVPRREWDMTPTRLDYYLAAAKAGTPIALSAKGDTHGTFAFQTREGGRGVLQITGFVESPRLVWIRYKLVQP